MAYKKRSPPLNTIALENQPKTRLKRTRPREQMINEMETMAALLEVVLDVEDSKLEITAITLSPI